MKLAIHSPVPLGAVRFLVAVPGASTLLEYSCEVFGQLEPLKKNGVTQGQKLGRAGMMNTALPPGPGQRQAADSNCGPCLTCRKAPQGPLDSSVHQLPACILISVSSLEPHHLAHFCR